jgi:hypothetical protein
MDYSDTLHIHQDCYNDSHSPVTEQLEGLSTNPASSHKLTLPTTWKYPVTSLTMPRLNAALISVYIWCNKGIMYFINLTISYLTTIKNNKLMAIFFTHSHLVLIT